MPVSQPEEGNANAVHQELPFIPYDGISHHALGGPSHTFKTDYTQYLARLSRGGPGSQVEVNLMIQPNNSRHVGTLMSLMLAFSLARDLESKGMIPTVVLDLCERPNSKRETIDGVIYQKGLRSSGTLHALLPDYYALFRTLQIRYGVPYRVRMESDILATAGMDEVIRDIIRERFTLRPDLSPNSNSIGIRAACPVPDCGLVDKYGVYNVYDLDKDEVRFLCPHHGPHTIKIASETPRLQLNNALWTLVIARLYQDCKSGYIQICGSDYAGFWQEQILWCHISKPIVIVYTPLIVDWSGSKISKSLYMKQDAYAYLRAAGQEYLCSYAVMKRDGKDIEVLCKEVDRWVREPYRLFRSYSLQYLHLLFESPSELATGLVIYQQDV